MGYPGAGKTFFTRQFAESYKLPCISEDRIRFELFENPQFNEDEYDIIARMRDYNLEQLMKTGSTVVCDGNLTNQKRRKQLYALAKQYGYRTLIVWLQTDMQTSQIRSSKRDRRNSDDKYSFNVDKATFQRIASSLERPSDKEPFVVISGKHAFKGQSLTVLRKITEVYASNMPQIQPENGPNRPKRQLIQ